MPSPTIIIVICEGASEYAYIQRLNAFLEKLPFPDGQYDSPLRFVGRPKKEGVTTGEYKAVINAFYKETRQNPSAQIWILVDADLYVRNDKSCGDNYQKRPDEIPPFHFSVFNFEDFLALHLNDEDFQRWKDVISSKNHIKMPLHNRDYRQLFKSIMPSYEKGKLPVDFITIESLRNLKNHLPQSPKWNLNTLNVKQTFANALLDKLKQYYPNLLSSP